MTHNFSEDALVEMYAQRVLELGRAYVAACEPLKALRLVDDAPSFLDGHPALAAFRANIASRVGHMASPESYRDYYGSMGESESTYGGAFKDTNLLTLPRADFVLAHAARPEIRRVMSIGCGDGTLEKALLETNPHIEMLFVSDLNPDSNLAIRALKDAFPGRVSDADALGFGPVASHGVDLIYACEVIEHVLDPEIFVLALVKQLAPGGVCLVTTPNPIEWVEFYHNDPRREPTIQHVHGVTARDLRDWFAGVGFVGSVIGLGGTLLAAHSEAPERLPTHSPMLIQGAQAMQAVLDGPLAIRDVYIPGPCRLANGTRLHAVNGAVFLPAEWYPKGNQ